MILVEENREWQIVRGNGVVELLMWQRKIKAVSRNSIKCNLAVIFLSQRNEAILFAGTNTGAGAAPEINYAPGVALDGS
jgi:hypothetical protein